MFTDRKLASCIPTSDAYFPYRLLESDFDFVETPSGRKSLQHLFFANSCEAEQSHLSAFRARGISIVIVVDLGEDKTIINRFVTQSAYVGAWNTEKKQQRKGKKKKVSHACRAFSLSRRTKSACPRKKGHARFVSPAFSYALHNTNRVGSRARFVPPRGMCITISLYDCDE